MTHEKLYTMIYVVLFAFATLQVVVEYAGILEEMYWIGFAVIILLSIVKAVFVAGYYQHLRWEPRGLTYVYLTGLIAAVALTVAAAYSIT
ncbi:MAG: cytochrome C oxidase subunit IV family protein [Halobacteriaceae archaeon]